MGFKGGVVREGVEGVGLKGGVVREGGRGSGVKRRGS